MALLNTPLDVFTVRPMVLITFGGLDFSLTNMSIFMVVVAIVVCTFFLYATFNKTLIPNTLQSFFESFFQFVLALVYKNIGKRGSTFFSFIFFLFSLILFTNALGLIPFSLAITGQ